MEEYTPLQSASTTSRSRVSAAKRTFAASKYPLVKSRMVTLNPFVEIARTAKALDQAFMDRLDESFTQKNHSSHSIGAGQECILQ